MILHTFSATYDFKIPAAFFFLLYVDHKYRPTCLMHDPFLVFHYLYYYYDRLLGCPFDCCGLVVTSFYLAVKYLREVTPYIRKASLLSDIGWELQRQFLGFSNVTQPTTKPDTRSVPLLLCCLARRLKAAKNNDNRVLEIHSPDGQQSCLLRASDTALASQWFVY